MKAEDWLAIFDVIGSIMAASQDTGVEQAVTLAARLFDLYEHEPVEFDDDDERRRR